MEAARLAYAALIKGSVEKVYTYADCASALEVAREHKTKHNERICDLAFLSVRNSNAVEVENAVKELKRICGNGLSIVLMVFWSIEGHKVGKRMIEKISRLSASQMNNKCMMNCISNFDMFLVKPRDADNKTLVCRRTVNSTITIDLRPLNQRKEIQIQMN